MNIRFEYTDTYGGESNYSWVERATYEGPNPNPSDLALVRAAKKWAGWNGHPARVENMGNLIAIYPRGACVVIFITWEY